ncbi:MAG: serine hydrolase domain-containing protein [Cecembia sp.]
MNTQFKHISTLLIFAYFAFSSGLHAQTPSQSDIDALIKTEMEEHHIPGVSYAIMQNGKYISSGVYGLAEVELNVPANEHTLFNVGSVGKTFTATAILLLEQDGKLSINDPVGKHLDGIPDSWNNMTIEHLLNHTSGIKDYCEDFIGYTLLPNIDRAVELTPEQYIEMCTTNPLNFPTGDRWAYSNSNYALLGFIIRKHIDASMDEFMRKRVFEPAGMMDTRYEDAFELRPNRAKGYHWAENGVKNGALISNFYSTIGDCGILTTGKDLAKWAPALVSGKILSKAQLDKMWTTYQLNEGENAKENSQEAYGLGWQLEDLQGSQSYHHFGGLMKGYMAVYVYFPEHDLSIAMMANRWTSGTMPEFPFTLLQLFLPK